MSEHNSGRSNTLPGYHPIHPRGLGASQGPTPRGYQLVSRWVDVREAKLWLANGATHVPSEVGGDRVYVTVFGAPQPGGTGPIRVDFEAPKAALHVAGHTEWRQMFQSLANVPIHNVTINVPEDINLSQISGTR
jgi:hypothetical protein